MGHNDEKLTADSALFAPAFDKSDRSCFLLRIGRAKSGSSESEVSESGSSDSDTAGAFFELLRLRFVGSATGFFILMAVRLRAVFTALSASGVGAVDFDSAAAAWAAAEFFASRWDERGPNPDDIFERDW
jgi:hypothetical protein